MSMKLLKIVAGLVIGFALSAPSHAAEISMCGKRDAVTVELRDNFGEMPVAMWAEKDNTARILYANEMAHTWTLVTLSEGDAACTMRNGVGILVVH